ncbi:MAG: GtrA family protein [bacterium]
MKIIDVVFALICGRVVAWIAADFLKGYGIEIAGLYSLLLYYVLPLFSLFCLWLAFLIGKKFLFVYQAAKHLLIGALAAVVDIKIFQLSAWLFSMVIIINPLVSKGISFLVATLVKYWGNKHWAFEKHEKEGIKEMTQFFIVTFVGLGLDLAAFYYFIKIMGPQFQMPADVWTELSIILAAAVAFLWNFLGYKFIVFKK